MLKLIINEHLTIYTSQKYEELDSTKYGGIALYFKDGHHTHAAKYGADNCEKTIECWNSKFGNLPIFCHDLDNVPDIYGNIMYFLRWEVSVAKEEVMWYLVLY